MKGLFVFCFAFFFCNAYSQHRYYCELKGIEKGLTFEIIFDFGAKGTYNVLGDLSNDLKLVNEKGEKISFNSMVDAANYMAEWGWLFSQAYSSVYEDISVIRWIFYKDAESKEKAKEGIMTKIDFKNRPATQSTN